PDLVVSYLVAANILAIFSKPLINSAKIVISIRYSYLRKADYDWLSSFLYFLEDKISFWSDLIIINSYTGAKMAAARGIPEKKMMVIPNGIDTEQFHPDTAARIESRQLFKIRPEDKVVGIIGRIDPTKDHATFLKAASIVIYQIPETYFLIVGSGEKQFELKQKALSESLGLSNNVIWISSQKDLLGVYNTLDVCVSSSLGEGFSNVISEAMACEIPCIVTDVGDSAQIVGDSGYVVPSGDEQEMAAAILKMLQLPQEPRRKLGKLAREKIISQFSVQKMVISSMDEFEKLGKI
ncbi:MAG TPA: glycosyltransferase, partial [Leptolinea sp.]